MLEENEAYASVRDETKRLADQLVRTIETHWNYIEQNHESALRALEDVVRDVDMPISNVEKVYRNLLEVDRNLDDEMTHATYAFKRVWEAVRP